MKPMKHPLFSLAAALVLAAATSTSAAQSAAEALGRCVSDVTTGTCSKETKAAMAEGGPAALQVGFGVLGQMAMQELMSNSSGRRLDVGSRQIHRQGTDRRRAQVSGSPRPFVVCAAPIRLS